MTPVTGRTYKAGDLVRYSDSDTEDIGRVLAVSTSRLESSPIRVRWSGDWSLDDYAPDQLAPVPPGTRLY